MKTIDEAAEDLTRYHFASDKALRAVWRIKNPEGELILLHVNELTPPTGVLPICFGPDNQIPYPSIIAEVTPGEFEEIRSGKLRLPDGWTIDGQILPGAPARSA